jgi:hypothetical protein
VTNKPRCALTEGECLEGCKFGFFGPCLRRQTMRRRPTSDEVVLRRGLIATVAILALLVAVEALL